MLKKVLLVQKVLQIQLCQKFLVELKQLLLGLKLMLNLLNKLQEKLDQNLQNLQLVVLVRQSVVLH